MKTDLDKQLDDALNGKLIFPKAPKWTGDIWTNSGAGLYYTLNHIAKGKTGKWKDLINKEQLWSQYFLRKPSVF
jgi:hypothetical protein